jgi:hypothetical protein
MISGDNPPKYCRWCGVRMPAPGMHEGSFKSETDCELEAVKSKLATTELMLAQRNEQIAARIRELAAAEQGWNKCDDAWEAEVKGMEAENAALQSRLDAALEHLQKGVAMLDHFARIGYVHNEKTLDWAREANNLSAVERQLPECRNCGTPSSVLTNGWCDGCMGMARV